MKLLTILLAPSALLLAAAIHAEPAAPPVTVARPPVPAPTPDTAQTDAATQPDASANVDDEGEGRIVGGHPAAAGTVPWQAEIYSTNQFTPAEVRADMALPAGDPGKRHLDVVSEDWERDHRCGGALIARDWIVTAGHCVDDANVPGGVIARRRVRIGSQSLLPDAGGTTYRIERAVLHKGYDAATLTDDIALLRIVADGATKPLDPKRAVAIRPIGPGDRPIAPDDDVSATGWGAVYAKRAGGPMALAADGRTVQRLSPTLKELNLTVRAVDACKGDGMGAYQKVMASGRALCVEARPGEGDCNGDSGGPLVRAAGGGKFLLAGLVSQGRGCAMGKPSVYTDVSAYRGWIADAMRTSVSGQLVRR